MSQLSLVVLLLPEELLPELPPPLELLLELPPLLLELLLAPEPDELELEPDEDPVPPELLLLELPVSPPLGAMGEAQPAYKNPTMRDESE